MFYIKYIILNIIIVRSQLNLYYTDIVSKNNNILEHNCLRIITDIHEKNISSSFYNTYQGEVNMNKYEIMLYCMNEFSLKYNFEEKINIFPKYTFYELAKEKIVSEQLYDWSAPIDLIEDYQFYLNQLSKSINLSDLEIKIFYNCTLPRFGSQCQYEFDFNYYHSSSLYEIIHKYYTTNAYNPTTLTCYMHLECYRGPSPSCLDWTEICDEKIDCSNGGVDEENCWQLEINECKDNEYRCNNGQCIPISFYRDSSSIRDCMDYSDESKVSSLKSNLCHISEPTVECEDRICKQGPITSSCVVKREDLLMKVMLSLKDNSTSDDCWFAVKCIFSRLYLEEIFCQEIYTNQSRRNIFLDTCPEMLYIPNYPIIFGDIYIAVEKSDLKQMIDSINYHFYICYNNPSRYDGHPYFITKILFNNRTCLKHQEFIHTNPITDKRSIHNYYTFIKGTYTILHKHRFFLNYTSTICNKSSMYQCMNSSKCIRIERLSFNRFGDCPYIDDLNMIIINNYSNIIKQLNKTHFYCQSLKKFLSPSVVNDGVCHCTDTQVKRCADEDVGDEDSSMNILFPTICDGFEELSPIVINDKNETDETECEQWACDNMYTHCDDAWNCPNGIDEIGCNELSRSTCSLNYHLCVSPLTYKFICLNISKVNDSNIDCIGGTDEPTKIIAPQQTRTALLYRYEFSCINHTSGSNLLPFTLCNGNRDCDYGDDEKFCETNVAINNVRGICLGENTKYGTDVEKFLCSFVSNKLKRRIKYLKLDNIINPVKDISENMELSSLSIVKRSFEDKSHCHRGFNLRVWLNNENDFKKNVVCLCPPSYYGDNCQYQNQRISLAIQFGALSDSWRTLFSIIISLIDDSDQRIIHSYEQINYLSLINCETKYQLYLLYSIRPKNSTYNYSIHIDIYEKKTLIYRGSLLFPIVFPFLPVQRLALIVDIPSTSYIENQICSDKKCINGICIKYSNNYTFCQCKEGWSGRFCTLKHICKCSFDSLCIGILPNNRSICVCPLNKFGPRCLLNVNRICENNNNNNTKKLCENDGECIPNNNDIISNEKFTCICQRGYSGRRCEIRDNLISLSFNKNIILPQEIFFHFIQIIENSTHKRSTTFRSISIQQNHLININWSRPFHIAFAELSNKTYYLIGVQNIYIQAKRIEQTINPSDRCLHINELFNKTFVELHVIRRIKYYHFPCQNQTLNLSCFYDQDHFCLCYQFGKKRLSNCFKFDHNMSMNCQGQSECENEGQCFQDYPICPTRSICKCSLCFFGQRCQLTTNGFGLSLDVILGYEILPYININNQSFIIKLSLGLTIIFIIIGFINGILSLITFTNKIVREVGCGLYLLGSSITTLLTTIMFGLKFFILLLSHMSIITNKTFLLFQCYSFDFILRIFLSLDQWLNACIAIERTINVLKGTNYNKKKSRKAAKLVTIILIIIISVTYIHDPIYRKLTDEINPEDNRQNRIWCILSYSSNLEIYNSFINTFHFIVPLAINLISAIVLVVIKIRQQSNLHKQRSYREILNKTIKKHKQLLTAPIVLVILGLPRIILIFISKCMQSASDSWLFLLGYFISFIPPMLTFLIFILPSTLYRETLRRTFRIFIINILRWFGFVQ